MSGRRLRRAAAAAALGLGAVLGALGILHGEDAPVWSIPLLAAAVLILCELVSLSRGPAPDAAVERPAVTAVLVGRLLVAALLAFAGATVALLAAAVPARYGLATGLLGAAAAAALFLLVAAIARRGGFCIGTTCTVTSRTSARKRLSTEPRRRMSRRERTGCPKMTCEMLSCCAKRISASATFLSLRVTTCAPRSLAMRRYSSMR